MRKLLKPIAQNIDEWRSVIAMLADVAQVVVMYFMMSFIVS